MGKSVAIIDIDPQASLEHWFEAQITGWATTIWASRSSQHRLASTREVANLTRGHDVVVVDSPPHAETNPGLRCAPPVWW